MRSYDVIQLQQLKVRFQSHFFQLFKCSYYFKRTDIQTNSFDFHHLAVPPAKDEVVDACVPNPCGNFGQCNNVRGSSVCHCLPNYYGTPPYCRPECSVNSDCPNTKSCSNERCIDPCPGSCGMDAVCNVINHVPNCACKPGYEGDAFVRCRPIVVAVRPSKLYV